MKDLADDRSTPSPMTVPAQKQLKFTPGIANGKVRGSATFIDTNKKVKFVLCFLRITMWHKNVEIQASSLYRDLSPMFFCCVQMVPMGQVSMRKLSAVGKQGGKLWRWKRSHHQWIVQFKWKWQKPWRLSEWIRHSDETLLKAKPRHKALPNKIM